MSLIFLLSMPLTPGSCTFLSGSCLVVIFLLEKMSPLGDINMEVVQLSGNVGQLKKRQLKSRWGLRHWPMLNREVLTSNPSPYRLLPE